MGKTRDSFPTLVNVVLLAVGSLGVISGCSWLTGPTEKRVLGIIKYYGDPIISEVPDTVQRGRAFEVSVRTYGALALREGDTEVEVEGLRASVTPFDFEVQGGIFPADLRLFEHSATLLFSSVGTARLSIRGREMPSGHVLTVERKIIVR